jgi:hypothetical protein
MHSAGWLSYVLFSLHCFVDRMPCRPPRKPAGNVLLVLRVCGSKASFQALFLDQWNIQGIPDDEHGEPDKQWNRAEQHRLSKKEQEDAKNHRIPDKAIWAVCDKSRRWIPRRRSALAPPGKGQYRPQCRCKSGNYGCNPKPESQTRWCRECVYPTACPESEDNCCRDQNRHGDRQSHDCYEPSAFHINLSANAHHHMRAKHSFNKTVKFLRKTVNHPPCLLVLMGRPFNPLIFAALSGHRWRIFG